MADCCHWAAGGKQNSFQCTSTQSKLGRISLTGGFCWVLLGFYLGSTGFKKRKNRTDKGLIYQQYPGFFRSYAGACARASRSRAPEKSGFGAAGRCLGLPGVIVASGWHGVAEKRGGGRLSDWQQGRSFFRGGGKAGGVEFETGGRGGGAGGRGSMPRHPATGGGMGRRRECWAVLMASAAAGSQRVPVGERFPDRETALAWDQRRRFVRWFRAGLRDGAETYG